MAELHKIEQFYIFDRSKIFNFGVSKLQFNDFNHGSFIILYLKNRKSNHKYGIIKLKFVTSHVSSSPHQIPERHIDDLSEWVNLGKNLLAQK